ncbi:hypothetical protein Tco_0121679 [Tanacetum coccineum]
MNDLLTRNKTYSEYNDIIPLVIVVIPSAEDVPVWSSSSGHTVEKVIESENNKGTQDKNVGQTPISSTVDPNLAGNRTNVVVPLESIRAISDWSSYARAMIELRADVELKNTIMVAIPKLVGGGILYDECLKNIGLSVAKNLKNPKQAPRGVPVSHKVEFKPVKQVYKPVSKKNNANANGNKNKDVESRSKVSNLNPYDVLYSVENDVDLDTNEGTSALGV